MTNRNAKHFGPKLKKMLEEREITQSELSKRSGIAQAAISLILDGSRLPTLTTACKLANAVDLDLAWAVTR